MRKMCKIFEKYVEIVIKAQYNGARTTKNTYYVNYTRERRNVMILEQLPLARQVDMVFKEIKEELGQLTSGTLFVQIRNNVIGKFGLRHLPIESKGGELSNHVNGLSDSQYQSFRQMAIESLKYKKSWTHGEICFDFTLKHNILYASVQFESNYNMASLSLARTV
jgi:hypothetical protein